MGPPVSDDLERISEVLDDLAAEREIALRHQLSADEVELARAAAFLKTARLDAAEPRPEFIEKLGARLAGDSSDLPAPEIAEPGVSRRGVLSRAAAAVAGLAVGGGGTAKIAYEHGRQDGAHGQASSPLTAPMVPADRGQGMDTGHAVAELTPGVAKRFRAGAVEGFVVNPGHGAPVYALSAACTHMGCAISWMQQSGTFVCPCHGAQYNADGTVLSGIARHPLPALRVEPWHDGHLYVWSVPQHPTTSSLAPYDKA